MRPVFLEILRLALLAMMQVEKYSEVGYLYLGYFRGHFLEYAMPFSFLKDHFFAGLLVIIPIGAIVWIFRMILLSLWRIRSFFPESGWVCQDHPSFCGVFDFLFAIGVAFLLAIGVSLLGWVSKHYLGRKILELINITIQRIPVIRSIYGALDQLLKAFAPGGGNQFHRVVYLEYPRKGVWSLAFVTGRARGPGIPKNHLNVYVPSSPNPTAGVYLLVSEEDVKESHMKVEEAFKVLLSLGIAQPASSTAEEG